MNINNEEIEVMGKNICIELGIPLDSICNLSTINNTKLPQRIIKSLESVEPDSILIVNEKPIILFFKYEDEDQKKEIFKKCWNFSESPIIIIENDSDFEVYNGFKFFISSKELEQLDKNGLNYISILNGDYFKYLNETKTRKQNKKVDTYLLENIKNAREILISKLQENSDKDLKYLQHIANSLIGRIIFIRYLIDRKVVLKKYKKALLNDDLKTILIDKNKTYDLFRYLKSNDGFNGDWFPILQDEEEIVQIEHLKTLEELISGSKLTAGQKNIQRSLFDVYDFSIIPIEFISNVYESFIGENEQKKSGAYYTPTFLVDYILKYTVDEYFKDNPDTYNCKVLDPACGSGIFLVETLRKLVSQFEKVKQKPISSSELKKLVQDNIFGIDKDKNAISISVFSLYLAMLDYQNPKELEKFKFPHLLKSDKNSTPNFFNNDFFDIDSKKEFNEILKKKNIDFIIGNPPYGRGTVNESIYALEYIKNNKIQIGNQDIVQPFMIRIKDFVSECTKIGFIVTSKVLYNLKSKDFRTKHFFNKFKVNHILELSSVRKEIFENADVPVSIIFYELDEEKTILDNVIKYISIKPNPYFKRLKTLVISKSDFKKVVQSKVLNSDYLWKILVYGSYLDFNFIKRLKEIDTIEKFAVENNILYKKGLKKTDGSRKIDVQCLLGFDYLNSRKEIESFYISKKHEKWETLEVGYTYREKGEVIKELYEPYSLLTTKGVSKDLRLKSAISNKKLVFQDTIFALRGTKNQLNNLKSILGLYNSSLFAYYMLLLGSSIGTEREQAHNIEKLLFPYLYDLKIVKLVEKIEDLKKEFFDNGEINNPYEYEANLKSLIYQLDKIILKLFNLNKQEYSLIDYTNNILIPWVIQKDYNIAYKKLDFKDETLEEYINIFIEHYSNIYNQNNMYFQVNILWDNYAIGVYFKILYEKPKNSITWKKEKNIQKFIELAGSQSLENLFIQKDIKGFEKDGFYVVKPNEYKNWHKAIGYLDFYEFKDAILRAGKVGN
jgi:hypothetical protein